MKYNKLVRDKIPTIIINTGKDVSYTYTKDDEDYRTRLCLKMIEEAIEFKDNPSEEEFVDMMEVLDAIKEHHGFFDANLQETKEAKHKEKGGFKERIILKEVTDE
jgi:predicted house-cleaning noncanonical NTP pyrophosphatase (MazG superfamily)